MPASRRTIALPLAVCYAALIVYASLYPFSGWRIQGVAPWSYLWAPWPRYWTGFDVVANLLGYLPLGFLLALAMWRSGRAGAAWPVGLGAPLLLSVLLEGLQHFLPQRVPSQLDTLLNALGAVAGVLLAWGLWRQRLITSWDRFRHDWLPEGAGAAPLVLALWPMALLYPTPVPYGLGQVWTRAMDSLAAWVEDTPFLDWLPEPGPMPPLSPLAQSLVVALCLWAPLLLGHALLRRRRQRLVFMGLWALVAIGVGGLSAALTYGPAHAWDWFTPPTWLGLSLAALLAGISLGLSCRAAAVWLLLALGLSLGLLNGAAPDSPYFAASLEDWAQGRFIRFHGFSQWLGWLWPYAALASALRLALRGTPPHYNRVA
jgi:VanZ family protein